MRSDYKKCKECGGNFDPGERCDCGRKAVEPTQGSENSGRCPFFVHRVDYAGEHMIECLTPCENVSLKKSFNSTEERDEHYATRCQSGGAELCAAYRELRGWSRHGGQVIRAMDGVYGTCKA